jgi:hypothetical protein
MPVSESLSRIARFEAGQYKPVTFLERGVTLPFTTPYLLGGRIRPGERHGAELVLANPGGLEGVYILPWTALPDICTPTLHDRALWDRVSRMPQFTPRSVREATRAVAVEGHAGRAAARAAASAISAGRQATTTMLYHLLLELVRQGEPQGSSAVPPGREAPAVLEARARAVLHRLCGDGSLTPAAAFEALDQLAAAFEFFGLRRNPTDAPLPNLAATIIAVVEELGAWSEPLSGDERGCGQLLAKSAALTLQCYRQAASPLEAHLDDLWLLLRRWRQAPEPILTQLARPEWLLDGWDLICALWRQAEPARRGLALADMAALVPVIPAEVCEWTSFDATGAMNLHRTGLRRWRRTVNANQDWMTGRQMELVARNETLRALTI